MAQSLLVEAISTLKEELLSIAEVITPNIPETEVLTDMEVKTVEDMEIATKKIYDTYHCLCISQRWTSIK